MGVGSALGCGILPTSKNSTRRASACLLWEGGGPCILPTCVLNPRKWEALPTGEGLSGILSLPFFPLTLSLFFFLLILTRG